MSDKKYSDAIILLAFAFTMITFGMHAKAQEIQDSTPQFNLRPPNATPCDISIPVHISLVPLNTSQIGSATRFQVNVESSLDPDLIRSMKVEYEVPERMPRMPDFKPDIEIPRQNGQRSYELGVVVPDELRYRIRARLVVQLVDGRTISQTATRWINLGEHVPDDMVGTIQDSDGTEIRIYRGLAGGN